MRSRLAKTMRFVFVTFIAPIAIFYLVAFTTAGYRSWRASKLLDCLHKLQPGQTAEAQARSLLLPFATYETRDQASGDPATQIAYYQISNSLEWEGELMSHLPLSWTQHLVPVPWTLFSATLHYRDGSLTQLRIIEMQQEQPGYVHPVSASVDLRSTRFEHKDDDNDSSDGFAVHHQNTQAYDNKGQKVGQPCCEEEFTTLDERASSQQRSQALNFQPSCLILSCKLIRKLRPPI